MEAGRKGSQGSTASALPTGCWPEGHGERLPSPQDELVLRLLFRANYLPGRAVSGARPGSVMESSLGKTGKELR